VQVYGIIGLIAIICMIFGIPTITSILSLSQLTEKMYQDDIQKLGRASEVSGLFQHISSDFMHMILARTPNEVEQYAKRADQNNAVMIQLASDMKNVATPEEAEILTQFLAKVTEFSSQRERIKTYASAGRLEDARMIVFDEADPTQTLLETQIEKLNELIHRSSETSAREGAEAANNTMLILMFGVLLLLGVSVAMSLFVASSVTRPLSLLVTSIENADLSTHFETDRKDEVGDLMRSFNNFVGTVKEALVQVLESSAAVASAASQISSSTEEMAAGAQQQSTQATDVSSAVEEMTRTIFDNAKNASAAADTAKTARQAAEDGGAVVERSISGMRRIAETVKVSAQTVRALGNSSNQIGEIILVINDIADQTNLLALNAAIEAARAGEQGRGFAVVADEVRKLAERTTKATKEIAEMIKQIQRDTKEAVTSMEQGTSEVDEGIKLADAAGTSLSDIVEISQRVTEKVGQIAAASEQQAGASEEISRNVEAISSVTQETASGIQQIARTAEDLTRLTERLQYVLGKFNLTADADATAPARTQHRNDTKGTSVHHSNLSVRSNGKVVNANNTVAF